MNKKSKKLKSAADRCLAMRAKLITQEPFFAVLAMSMDMVEDNTIETLATDAKNVYYNPAFVDTLTDGELTYITLHEVMHAALGHLWRRENRDSQLWNIAADYVINAYLDELAKSSKLIESPKEGLHDAQYVNDSAEEVYKKLQQQQQAGGSMPQEPSNHGKWAEATQGMTAAEKQLAETQWGARMLVAQQSNSKNAGKLPAGLQRALDALTKSRVDWRQALADFLVEEINDYGWAPPDARIDPDVFGTYMPGFTETDETVKNLRIYIDTSGSMDAEQITRIVSEIKGMIEQYRAVSGIVNIFNGDVLDTEFDLENVDFTKMATIEGGGGTSFQAVADHLASVVASGQEVSACLVLTDGYDTFPDEACWTAPVVWMLTEEHEDGYCPYGKQIQIPAA